MIFPQDPKIDIGKDGFAGKDLLGRKEFGQRLTNLVDQIEQPLVIALDGEWGSGKSHFLKLWAGAHKHELNGKAEVIYFDAFEHDFLDDPLVSLVSRLAQDQAAKGWSQRAVDSLKKAAFPLAKLGLRVGLFAASAGVSEIVGAVGDAVASKVTETADDKIKDFWNREEGRINAMQGFRDALTALTLPKKKDGENPQKIVFIIDELDRCRPDYALNLLEIIKHFFAVPNVHFVLGVNLRELENTVKARYGSDIKARKYLQKFVMLEIRLPETSIETTRLNALEFLEIRAPYFIKSPQTYSLVQTTLEQYSKKKSVTIRDMQRILTTVSLGEFTIKNEPEGYQRLWLDTAILKVLQPSIYEKIRLGSAVFGDLTSVLNFKVKAYNAANPRRNVEISDDQTDDLSSTDHTQFHSLLLWAVALEAKEYVLDQYGFSTYDFAFLGAVFGDDQTFAWEHAKRLFQAGFDTFTLLDTP